MFTISGSISLVGKSILSGARDFSEGWRHSWVRDEIMRVLLHRLSKCCLREWVRCDNQLSCSIQSQENTKWIIPQMRWDSQTYRILDANHKASENQQFYFFGLWPARLAQLPVDLLQFKKFCLLRNKTSQQTVINFWIMPPVDFFSTSRRLILHHQWIWRRVHFLLDANESHFLISMFYTNRILCQGISLHPTFKIEYAPQ